MGENAAAYTRGEMPNPVLVPTRGEALGARFHGRIALIYAIETAMTSDGASPVETKLIYLETKP